MDRIIYNNESGGVSVIIPSGEVSIEQLVDTVVPDGATYEVVSVDKIPTDRTFRNAWVKAKGKVNIDIPSAKEIAHELRRIKREEEFKPLDDIIAKQIPGKNPTEAETTRQQIRDKYATMQTAIDAATTPDEIKQALGLS